MKPISIQRVCEIVGGSVISGAEGAGREIARVCTDTRQTMPGSLFVAIRGETHDGIGFLTEAAAKGALAALVDREPPVRPAGMTLINVGNARQAMGMLARYAREQLTGSVVGVGGSNGKTGTKHLIDSVLSRRLRGTMSPKSFNNDIGVPLAIFPAEIEQDYLVLEIGTNHHGEVRTLTKIALPDIAVITNVSAEHLEGLGDLAGVCREEASIIEGLNPKGLLVVNGDDPQLLEAVSAYTGKRVTFGLKPTNQIYASDVACGFDGVRFKLNGERAVFVPLMGNHVAVNALAAVAVARQLGLADDEIVELLGAARGPEMRLELQQARGITLLNDSYNANPASMRAAIETLCSLPCKGRRVAVLGDMKELGESSEHYHREMGSFLSHMAIDLLICVGDGGAWIADAAQTAGYRIQKVMWFKDSTTAAESAPKLLNPLDLVLLKASRGMKFESIATAIVGGERLKAAS